MKKVILAVGGLTASANAAFAVPTGIGTQVPEISALEGTAAIAVLAAMVLLVWERRRRAS